MSDKKIDIEKARKRLEVKRVSMGIEENEFKILEREADIERLEHSIEVSKKHVAKLKKELGE